MAGPKGALANERGRILIGKIIHLSTPIARNPEFPRSDWAIIRSERDIIVGSDKEGHRGANLRFYCIFFAFRPSIVLAVLAVFILCLRCTRHGLAITASSAGVA
jgi:hypothetical protein